MWPSWQRSFEQLPYVDSFLLYFFNFGDACQGQKCLSLCMWLRFNIQYLQVGCPILIWLNSFISLQEFSLLCIRQQLSDHSLCGGHSDLVYFFNKCVFSKLGWTRTCGLGKRKVFLKQREEEKSKNIMEDFKHTLL